MASTSNTIYVQTVQYTENSFFLVEPVKVRRFLIITILHQEC